MNGNLTSSSGRRRRKALFAAVFAGILALATLLGLELALRIHNPFPVRVRFDRIQLPVNSSRRISNDKIPVLEPVITHSKNSLGFRGPEPPEDLAERLSLITVGGSTTECYLISDGGDWSNLLADKLAGEFPRLWLNNAGMDGHSTFGHQVLLEDYLLKLQPDIIIFLVGCNDVDREDLSVGDFTTMSRRPGLLKDILRRSEVFGILYSLYLVRQAQRLGVQHSYIDVSQLVEGELPDAAALTAMRAEQQPLVDGYRARLERLLETCLANGVEPILVTQPSLGGPGVDPATGRNLARVNDWGRYWEKLEMYNQATRIRAGQQGIFLVDLARKLPKNSQYFYDEVHFTPTGNAAVAEIMAESLRAHLRDRGKAATAKD